MKIKRLRREETPRIVGDDSARSEPTEVADSNDFKPLLKEKRLKEQTDFVGDCWNATTKGEKYTLVAGDKKAKERCLWRRMRLRETKKERKSITQGYCGKRIKATQKKQQRQGNKTNLTFVLVKDTEMGVKVVWGRNLHFEVKKGATTQRRSLGRRPRTTWPGWKDTVNKKGSRDDCGYESKSTHRKERKTFVGNGV
ncbi:hypothetical protein Tco_0331708 [Tanacetum coccineum]